VERDQRTVDTLGKLAGIVVFIIGVVLLGLVFKYTLDTVRGAEHAVRVGSLEVPPLFRADDPWAKPIEPMLYERPQPAEQTESPPADQKDQSPPRRNEQAAGAEASKGLSPLVRFAIIVGARIVGLCALGFIAGLIATQGARMAGGIRPVGRREST